MIKPLNRHLLIDPVVHDSFIASSKETYEEIGIVLDIAEDLTNLFQGFDKPGKPAILVGTKVYFDAWTAAKYPAGENKFYWLVKFDDIRAYEPLSE